MGKEHEAIKDFLEKVEHDDSEEKKRGPLKFIVAIFLIVIVAMWIIPTYGIKLDPRPERVPAPEEVIPENMTYTSMITLSLKEHVIVDSEIKGVADRIVTKSCTSSSDVCYARALFYFVRDNFNYVQDPSHQEYIKTAKESLVNRGGDCDDASVLLSTLLESIGISTRFVHVPGHVYVEAWIPDAIFKYKSDADWVPLDATCQSCDFGDIHYSYSDDEKSYVLVD